MEADGHDDETIPYPNGDAKIDRSGGAKRKLSALLAEVQKGEEVVAGV